MLIAAVAMFDTRDHALPEAVAIAPGGLRAGFYPFWSAALILVTGALVMYQTWAGPGTASGPFEGRRQIADVLRVILPMVVATALIPFLGFYIVTALYVAAFMRFVGGYRAHWSVITALLLAVTFFVIFEQGFRVALPKSFLYVRGVLPF